MPKLVQINDADVKPASLDEVEMYLTDDPLCSWATLRGYLAELGPVPFLFAALAWLTAFLMLGDTALPGGMVFSMGLLWWLASFLGARAGQVGLPPLVGMLLAGFLLKNVEFDGWAFWPSGNLNTAVATSLLKGVALAVIMLRAGFGLDLKKLMANAVLMGVLSWIPAFVEATTIMLLSNAIFGFPTTWGYLLGFVVADVSPAVTVPLLLDFQLQGYGTDKGIPTILLAGSGFNSVFAIIAYGVTLSFIFAGGAPIWLTVTIGLGQVFLGVFAGVFFAYILEVSCWPAAASWEVSDVARFQLVLLFACVCIFGGGAVGMSGGGTLAVVVIGICVNNSVGEAARPVQDLLNYAWKAVGQPYLFGLLGTAVSLSALTPSSVSGGTLCVFVGLVLRAGATFVCTLTTDWNFKEKMFTCITWCPKATVQAALSTVALDYVTDSANRKEFDDDGGDTDYDKSEEYATVVLTVAVLSIILTAPAFAVAMKYAGETWLVKAETAPPGSAAAATRSDSDAADGFDPQAEVSIKFALGKRKDTLTSTLGDRKISIGGDGNRGFRVPTITTSEATPAGVRSRMGAMPVYKSSQQGGGGSAAVRRRSNTAPGRTSFASSTSSNNPPPVVSAEASSSNGSGAAAADDETVQTRARGNSDVV